MNIIKRILGAVVVGLACANLAYAGGAAAARKGKGGQQQQQMIMQQQIIMQRQMQEAQQKAVVEMAIQQRAMEAAMQQRTAQVAAEAAMQAQAAASQVPVQATIEIPAEEPEEIADFSQVLQSLDTSSEVWPLIMDNDVKQAIVDKYVQDYRKQGVAINGPIEGYAAMIDEMTQQSPQMLQSPFPQVLQVAAIIQYDFNNGQDKDVMAMKILGSPEAAMQNKRRLGIP